jgi:hypothetical protein|tara:strand:+ start:988 stop:1338 length:351 start_codon:yes stop_codon:yes gene_type:complete
LTAAAITAFITALVLSIATKRLINSERINDLDIIFTDYGDEVGVRRGGDSRFFRLSPKRVKKDRIVKIQQAGCISLFTKGGNAIDILALDGNRERITNRAKELFPHAEVVIIEVGR